MSRFSLNIFLYTKYVIEMSLKPASDLDNDVLPCPVCNRNFSKNNIEVHVNRCIFLNTQIEQNVKRSLSPNEKHPPAHQKRARVEKDCSTSRMDTNEGESQRRMLNLNKIKTDQAHINHKHLPLAESMRPILIDDIVGQQESFGIGSMLHSVLSKNKIPNMILWGPPGCGKTSIGNVIANVCKGETSLRFIKLSATIAGINDVKEVVKVAKNEAQFRRHTILFMDEIHRFNKLQQDAFLPHVENGTITLIGATTENPSFSLNNALLSRCRVVVLEKLTVKDVTQILEKAVKINNLATIVDDVLTKESTYEETMPKLMIERLSLKWLAEMSDGDARIALGALELAIASQDTCTDQRTPSMITLQSLKDGIKRTHILYDRKGEEHYNIISALQKSIRASDDNAALYWSTRALHGGEDPLYIARRLIRTACEDIGLGDPNAIVEAVACLEGCKHIGMPECDVLLAQCAVRLARAPKSTEVYHAMKKVQRSLKEAPGPLPLVPLPLRNAPTKLMKDLGYGEGYNKHHRDISGISYMPEGLENINYFNDDSS